MKHFSLKLAAAILLLLCCVSVQAQDFEENGVYYNITGYNSCEVTNGGKTGQYSGDIVIPSKVSFAGMDYNVTGIGNEAFRDCKELTSISIPNTVKIIGTSAFSSCGKLTAINLPNSVEIIGDFAFSHCNLKNITIPNSVTSIGYKAFVYNHLQKIGIPNSVTSIANEAFYNNYIQEVNIPQNVTYIGHNVWGGFKNYPVKKFTIDKNNSKYLTDGISLLSRGKNDSVVLEDFIVFTSSYQIPNIVTSIRDSAFFNRGGITNVKIPNSVKTIGHDTFSGCSDLANVTIPNSVINIDERAFQFCGLRSINIPNSITTIKEDAFSFCQNLTSVTIPNSVKNIELRAFHLTNLKGIYIPHSVVSIGNSAFNCDSLASITIGYSVKEIGYDAFGRCKFLKRVVVYAPEPPTCKSEKFGEELSNGAKLYVPVISKEKYMAVSPWKDIPNEISNAPETAFNISLTPAPDGKSYGTAYLPFSAQRPEDGTSKFYFASTPAEGSVKLNEVKDAWIPAKTGFVVIDETGADKATVIIRYSDPEGTLPDNALQGCLNDSTIEDAASKVYVLGNSKGVEGFFRPNSNVMKANRAFLPSTAEFKTLSFSFDNNTTTGIEGVTTEPTDDNAPVYDLSGRRVYCKLPKGIYIKQGRKFYVK